MFIYHLLLLLCLCFTSAKHLHTLNVAYVWYAYIKSIHSLVMNVTNPMYMRCCIYLPSSQASIGKERSTTRKVIKVATKPKDGIKPPDISPIKTYIVFTSLFIHRTYKSLVMHQNRYSVLSNAGQQRGDVIRQYIQRDRRVIENQSSFAIIRPPG